MNRKKPRENGARRGRAAAFCVACLVGVVCLAGVGPAGSAPDTSGAPILPLIQVQAGMDGYGLTVVHGTDIERFNVKILGVLHGGPASDLILFRATGPTVQASGGTASGMSGSPIYVGNRIVGALSYGYHFAGPDADLSLATPIEEMLKVLAGQPTETGLSRLYQAADPILTPAGLITRVMVMDTPADASAYNAHPLPRMVAVAPVSIPVVASGITGAAWSLVAKTLRRYNVVPLQGYGGMRDFPSPPVEPGSSLGVELVRGDVEIGAIGTVTYRRGNTILAFGHPLLNAGGAAMLLTSAWIDTIVRSVDFPFKEGSTGALIGTVTQDRGTGLAGVLGQLPRTFGVRVTVSDEDRRSRKLLGAMVVRRTDLAEGLVPAAVLSLVQKGLDRVSGGSAQVHIVLRARGVPKPIVRDDLAFDAQDIATASVLDIPAATQLLFGNYFRDLNPVDMAVDVSVSSKPNTALLVEARPSARTLQPGDKLTVAVSVAPYGDAAKLSREVTVTVPRDFPAGPAFLLVGTAGALNNANGAPPAQQFQQLVQLEGTPPVAGSLNEAIDQFEHSGKNTELLVELVPEAVLTAAGSNANPGVESVAGTTIPTDWVVLGRFQIPMTVK